MMLIRRETTGLVERTDELKLLEEEGIITSYTLHFSPDSLECVVDVPVPRLHFNHFKALLSGREGPREDHFTITVVFRRPTGDPDLEKFSLAYSKELKACLGLKTFSLGPFKDIRSLVAEASTEIILLSSAVEQQWEQRAYFVLDAYTAFENMVGV